MHKINTSVIVNTSVIQQQQHPFNDPFSGTTRLSRYEKGKTNLDLLEQETGSGSGISWAYANLHLAPDR